MARWTINWNGDNRETYVSALHQIEKARETLLAALARFPHHGRNYQTNKNPPFDIALDTAALGRVFAGLGNLERWEKDQLKRLSELSPVDNLEFKPYLVK